jgi:hypothetical protein
MRTQEFKKELARVFDDNLHTKQWHNYVDYAIIGLILLSTAEIFISTFHISATTEKWMKGIRWFGFADALEAIEYEDIEKLMLIAKKKIRAGDY